MLFLRLYNTDQFDPPIWSLVYEMRISLIFPLLCGFVLRLKSRWSLVIAGGLTVIAVMFERMAYIGDQVRRSIRFIMRGFLFLAFFWHAKGSRLGAWFHHRSRIRKGS